MLPDGSKPRPLRGAEADADAIAELLIGKFGFAKSNVTLLKGEHATLSAIRAGFKRFQMDHKPGDRFVFHFSGHGTQIPDQKPFDEDDDLDEALCVFDAESSGKNLLVDDELGRWLEDLPSTAVTVLLDCCHAGTGHKELDDEIQSRFLPSQLMGSGGSRETPWRDLRGQQKSFNRQTAAFFACRSEQQAYERRLPGAKLNETIRAGQFTHFLCQGLQTGDADLDGDGRITQQEVQRYLERRLNESFNAHRSAIVDQQLPILDSARPGATMFFFGDKKE